MPNYAKHCGKFIAVCFLVLTPFIAKAATWAAGEWRQNESNGLNYWLYVPKSLKSGTTSLVLQLHGCFSKAEAYKDKANWLAAAETHRMVVAIPQSPDDASIPGCWDAISANYESSRHTDLLISLVHELLTDRALRIDRTAVFAAGLSAGATQSILLGCKHPDLFAGIAAVAGPMLGSQPNEVYKPHTSIDDVVRNCLRLAGGKMGWFQTQKISIFVSDRDWVVNPVHSARSFGAIKQVYGVTNERELDLTRLPGRRKDGSGIEVVDSRGHARISYIIQEGLGHAWPTGTAISSPENDPENNKGFNAETINYPLYLGEFFSRRLR